MFAAMSREKLIWIAIVIAALLLALIVLESTGTVDIVGK
jgi:hypothetical protein